MNILLLGSGGREHALSSLISASPLCTKLFISPGNAGTALCGQNVKMDQSAFEEVRKFVLEQKIDFVIVGPEDPIVKGIADFFAADEALKNTAVLAPSKAGAQLEGSKEFAKIFMQKYGIPTAAYQSFDSGSCEKAKAYLDGHRLPVVIKADGLAAGKGVVICQAKNEAMNSIDDLFVRNKFGKAGDKVVIEEFLDGIELSVFVLTDGKDCVLLPAAKDYKRAGENDTGPNTGGMGCVSPPPFADDIFMKKVVDRIINPTVNGLKEENISYRGFIFFGLINCSGDPFVIEYNVRLGDPESEVVLPRIDEDLLPLMLDAAKGKLGNRTLRIKHEYAAAVMLVSGGYPGDYEKDKAITGLENNSGCIIYHAGTSLKEGQVVTSGGRVLCITSLDAGLDNALRKSYSLAEKISFDKKYFRRDIGRDLLKYL